MAEQHGKTLVPQIRFAGFTDPWEQRKLGEELGFLRNNTLSRAELSDSEGTVFDIHYGDVLIKYGSVLDAEKADVPRIANDAVANRQTCDCLQDGDVIIADTAEDSAVGKCTELCNSAGKKVFSGLHTMPLRPMRKYASGYLGHYMNSPAFHDQLLPLMQGIKVISVSRSAMEDMTMSVPSVAEQASIGAFFDRLDSLITLHQRKYDKLCVLKKSMLDKMFPKRGSLYPEIRFAGFTDPWEQRKLGELFVIGGSGGTPSATNASYYGGDIPFLGISDIKNRDITTTAKSITEKGLENSAAWIIPAGSICLAMYASVGKAGINRVSLATSQAFYNMVFEDETLRDFIYTRLEKADTDNEWNPLISTGTQANLNADKVKSFRILLPSSGERRLIAKYFADLDSLITLHQRKLELLRNIKKSMLDKMFV